MSEVSNIEFDMIEFPFPKDTRNVLDKLDESVKKIFWVVMSMRSDSVLGLEMEKPLISQCESPIEQMMFIALREKITPISSFTKYEPVISVQEKFEYRGNKYRVDLLVSIGDVDTSDIFTFAVECDGHEFHEKTKEQARKDKQRERDLQKLGITVIRFSGSEIFENPFSCADEVIEIVKGRIGIGD